MATAWKIKKELMFELMLFSIEIALIILFFRKNALLLIFLLAAWLMGFKFWHKKHDIHFFIAGAVIGFIGEAICVYLGVWQYANPSFLGIPIWLPVAWGLAAMLIKNIAETFARITGA